MARNLIRVILNKVKNLDLSIGSKERDPSAAPQDDIATRSQGEREPVSLIVQTSEIFVGLRLTFTRMLAIFVLNIRHEDCCD
jgi:hypothetical protein